MYWVMHDYDDLLSDIIAGFPKWRIVLLSCGQYAENHSHLKKQNVTVVQWSKPYAAPWEHFFS